MFSDGSASMVRNFQKGCDWDGVRRERLNEKLCLRRNSRAALLRERRFSLRWLDRQCCDNSKKSDEIPAEISIYKLLESSGCMEDKIRGVVMMQKMLLSQDGFGKIDQKQLKTVLTFVDVDQKYGNQLLIDKLHFETCSFVSMYLNSECNQTAKTLVSLGALEKMMQLVKNSKDISVLRQSLWALGNIANKSGTYQCLILKNGFLTYLLNHFHSYDLLSSAIVMWFLSILCKNLNANNADVFAPSYLPDKFWKEALGLFDMIKHLLDLSKHHFVDCEKCGIDMKFGLLEKKIDNIDDCDDGTIALPLWTLKYALKCLAHLTALQMYQDQHLHHFVDIGLHVLTTNVVMKCMHSRINEDDLRAVCEAAQISFSNVTTAKDWQLSDCLVKNGYLGLAGSFLEMSTGDNDLHGEVMFALSNILAGTEEQIEMVTNNDVLVKHIVDLSLTSVSKVRTEAIFCICNSLQLGCFESVCKWVQNRAIEALIKFAECQHSCKKYKYLRMVLDCLRVVLDAGQDNRFGCDIPDVVEFLGGKHMLHAIDCDEKVPKDVCQVAGRVLSDYWPEGVMHAQDKPTFKWNAKMFEPKQMSVNGKHRFVLSFHSLSQVYGPKFLYKF